MQNDEDRITGIDSAYDEPIPSPQELYLSFHKQLHETCYDLTKRKQGDYCQLTSDDPYSVFENFQSPAHDGITDCITVLRCRLSEKYKRLNVCMNKGDDAVEYETIDDTIQDIINIITLITYHRYLDKCNSEVPF